MAIESQHEVGNRATGPLYTAGSFDNPSDSKELHATFPHTFLWQSNGWEGGMPQSAETWRQHQQD